MTLKELREKVADSNRKDELQALEFSFSYIGHEQSIKLEGITSLYQYAVRQTSIIESINNPPDVFTNIKDHFSKIKKNVRDLVNGSNDFTDSVFSRKTNDLVSLVVITPYSRQKIIAPDSETFQFLLSVHESRPDAFQEAYHFFLNDNRINLSTQSQFLGAFLAAEHELQDYTNVLKRRNSEKRSLAQIRSSFENHLSEAESHLQEYLNRTKEASDDHTTEIINLKDHYKEEYSDWFNGSKSSFEGFMIEAEKEAERLKEVYVDGLRFEGPAEYWSTRAGTLKKEGRNWFIGLSIASLVTAISIMILLLKTPDGMTTSLFKGEPVAIKWTVLYVTLISVMAYAIRSFARLTFSCYHLARDAEEREQLTHVYLALKKDANVEEKDRLMILQSLFSRSETGLLKDDSSPTMPHAILKSMNGG